MKAKRSWDEVHLGPRPLLFAGWDDLISMATASVSLRERTELTLS